MNPDIVTETETSSLKVNEKRVAFCKTSFESLQTFAKGVESKPNPFDINLKGWSNELGHSKNEFIKCFENIYDKLNQTSNESSVKNN